LAGLTKEQKAIKDIEKEEKLKLEIEGKVRKEIEEKYKNETATNLKDVKIKKKIPLETMIPVKSGVQGLLVYVSRKTIGYQLEWESYGAIEYVELGELLSMKNTSKSFYINNWIFFEDTDNYSAQDIYDFLDVSKHYKNIIMGEDLDELFKKTPDEIRAIVKPLSKGIKENIAIKARLLIDSGEFDSNNRIKVLEELLNVELNPSF